MNTTIPDHRNASLTLLIFSVLLVLYTSSGAASESTAELIQPTVTEDQIIVSAYTDLIAKIPNTKLKALPDLIQKVSSSIATPEQSRFTLKLIESLIAGELHYKTEDAELVVARKNNNKQYDLFNLVSGELLQRNIGKKSVKKIRTSNKIRKSLRRIGAAIQLSSSDPQQRISAIKNLIAKIDQDTLTLLKNARVQEADDNVTSRLNEAIALGELDSTEEITVISALEKLEDSLEPQVRNAVTRLSEGGDSEAIRSQAATTLNSIRSKVTLYGYLERVFFGLSLGSVLLLVAAGLAITFGVMGVINMAHGELIMLGAYTTYVVQLVMPNHIEYSLLVAIPAAFAVSGLFGIAIERGVIQFLKGRPLETLLATFGISLILQQLVRTVFSPLNRQVITPEFLSGAWQINPVLSLTYNRIYILAFAVSVFLLLLLMMKRTSLGLYVRAVSQNRNMARSMGVRSEWIDALTFGLGSGVAGLAGVALSQITNVGPNLGQSYIIDSFMVVVFGGVGNLWGTFIGAFTIGALNKFLEPVTGTVLATIIVLVIIILFIQRNPKGLFPQKGRATES